jgi:NAD(P)-dependent dehydrogenase (short-subunit alcohol dehydrogenase family)
VNLEFREDVMDLGLKGKKALVTGGEQGIGRDICLSLAREGVDIAYCDVKIESGNGSGQEEVRGPGRKVLAMKVDVSAENQVIRFVQTAMKRWGALTSSSAMPGSSSGNQSPKLLWIVGTGS